MILADMAKIGALTIEAVQALADKARAMGRVLGVRHPLPPRAAAQFVMVARGRYHGTRKRTKALRRAMRLTRGGL